MTRLSVEVPPVASSGTRFFAEIEGLTALLMHRWQGGANDGQPKRAGKSIPTAEAEAEASAYRLPSGELYVPAVAVRQAMVEAAKQFKDPNYARATLAKPIAATLAPPDSEGFVLHNGDGGPARKWAVDVRRVVVQRGAITRGRARIDLPWSVTIEMGFDAEIVPPEVLAQVLAMAGQKVGLLDFRPQKGGPYGRFAVRSFEIEV